MSKKYNNNGGCGSAGHITNSNGSPLLAGHCCTGTVLFSDNY